MEGHDRVEIVLTPIKIRMYKINELEDGSYMSMKKHDRE